MSMLYGELTSPTAVTHAIQAHLLSPDEQNLIIAKSSLLQIFRMETSVRETQIRHAQNGRNALGDSLAEIMLGEDGGEDFMGDDSQVQLLRHEKVGRLVLVEEIHLSGTITGIVNLGRLQNIPTDLDCIAISFLDAKVSVLFWESEIHSLTTLSIHFYERESHKSLFSDTPTPHLFKDHHNRCLILRYYTDMYAILPIRQPDDDIDEILDTQQIKPYLPSFVVNGSQLEETIAHILDEAFLQEYREPTLAILYSGTRTSTGLLDTRKDTVTLLAVTLDLQQRASTTIFSIQGLPYDCFRVLSLPPPVGGLLVLGTNQVIHVDQAGRCTSIGVNIYASKSTEFPMSHRPKLKLTLEGAVPAPIGNEDGDVVLALRDSTFVRLQFIRDGRNVTDIELETIDISTSPGVGMAGFSCSVTLESERIFFGSTTGDSILLGYTLGRKAVDGGGISVGMNDTVDDLNEIYGDDEEEGIVGINSSQGKLRLHLHDYLMSTAPIRDATFAAPALTDNGKFQQQGVLTDRELLCVTNCDAAGSISIFRKSVIPIVIARLPTPNFVSFTTLRTKPDIGPELAPISADVDRYLLASKKSESIIYKIGEVFEEVRRSEFNRKGGTIAAGCLLGGAVWAQIVNGEIRLYDHRRTRLILADVEIRVHQLIPITDEEFGAHSRVRSASITDPWIFLVLENGKVVLYEINTRTKDVEMHPKILSIDDEFVCGSIFQGRRADFLPRKVIRRAETISTTTASLKRKREIDEDIDLYGEEDTTGKQTRASDNLGQNGSNMQFAIKSEEVETETEELEWLLFLVSQEGALQIRRLGSMEVIFHCDDFAALPRILFQKPSGSDITRRAAMTVDEVLVTNLGDTHVEPHMLVRTELNDIIIYKPFQYTMAGSAQTSLRFAKIFNPHLTREPLDTQKDDDDIPLSPARMFALPAISGHAAVFVCGLYPGFILKTSHSLAQFHKIVGEPVRSVCRFNVMSSVEDGFLYYDSTGVIRICQLPSEFEYHGKWSVRRVQRGKDVSHIESFEQHGLYALATNSLEEFLVVDDEGQPKDVPENPLEFLATTPTSALELVHPISWKTIDTFELSKYETIMSLKQVDLQVSEESKRRRSFLAMGTATLRGEDAGTKGNLYVFDISQVVPQPGRPETNRKLRLAWSEEVRGAVTVINEVRGYLLSSQGQKVMVRAFGENDKEFLPVAFYDLSMVVTVAECIRDFVLFGDIMHSICFIGFQEEPYRMTLLGRDHAKMEVACGDFLLQGESLFFAVADGKQNLHIFQYDPENPQSLSGSRLIRRADFHVGHFLTRIIKTRKMVPGESNDDPADAFLGMTTSRDGNLGFISPINERVYRRLNILQGQVINNEEQPAALNPRAHRISTHDGRTSNPARGVLDREILLQFTQLSGQRKAGYAKKSGISVARLLGDLVEIERSLPYL